MKLKLSQLEIGKSATVNFVAGEGKIRRRLFDMGITPGTEVFVRKKAPLGDPIEITLRGYEVALRKTEASIVTVEEIQ
ncbi:MAG: ferrous iron transport protein A [Clostridia bacterium]|nr:ferrous iron transport protein A [Clostridia bacterium]